MDIKDYNLSAEENIIKIIKSKTCSMPDCNMDQLCYFAFEETIHIISGRDNESQISFWLYCKNHFPYHYSNKDIMRRL